MVTVHPNTLQTHVQTGGRGLCKASTDTDPLRSQASGFCSLGLCFLLCKLGGLEQSPRLPPAVMLCNYEVYLSIRRPFGSGGYSLAVSLRSFSSWLPRLVQVYGQVWCCGSLFLCDKIEDTEEFQFLDSRLFGLCTMPVLSFLWEVPRTAAASDALFLCCSENCYRLPSVLAQVSWAIIVPLLRGHWTLLSLDFCWETSSHLEACAPLHGLEPCALSSWKYILELLEVQGETTTPAYPPSLYRPGNRCSKRLTASGYRGLMMERMF